MEDYELGETLGGGSFAVVIKAKEKNTGEDVAFKILKKKYSKWEDCLELRECKSLQRLHEEHLSHQKGNENIIKLKQIIYEKDGTLNLVLEFMQKNLFELMKDKAPKHFSESQIKAITFQTLHGLSFMHKYGFFHRDLKPENLLIKDETVKIADFGLAREIRSVPPYTEYVSTRYYRAPECILKSTNYNSPVDIWALGCIMAEMYLHPLPLFVGNNEKEVLYKICSILGTPTYTTWLEGIQQAKLVNIKFPNFPGTALEQIIPKASSDAIDLMYQMLNWDPNKRATANALLQHPFFTRFPMTNRISTPDYDNTISYQKGSVKKYSNKPKNSANNNIPSTVSMTKKEDDYNKILEDTDGFEKFILKLKNETTSSSEIVDNNQVSSAKNNLNEKVFDKVIITQPYMPQQSNSNNTVINNDIKPLSNIPLTITIGNKYDSPLKERRPLDFDSELQLNYNDKNNNNRKRSAMNHLDRNNTEGILPQKSQDQSLFSNSNINCSNNYFTFKNSDFKLPSTNSPRLQPSILKADYSRRNKGNAFNDSSNANKKDTIGMNHSKRDNSNDIFKKLDDDMIIGDSHFNRKGNKSPPHDEIKHTNSSNVNTNTSPNHTGNEILFGMESRRGKTNLNTNTNTSIINNMGSYWGSSSSNKGEFI